VRLLNGEKAKKVPKKIDTLGARCRARLDMQLAVRHLVVWQSARLQARHVSSSGDRIFVFVRGPVNDSVDHFPEIIVLRSLSEDHCPMVMGKVRA
jgi:hypothetical protein